MDVADMYDGTFSKARTCAMSMRSKWYASNCIRVQSHWRYKTFKHSPLTISGAQTRTTPSSKNYCRSVKSRSFLNAKNKKTNWIQSRFTQVGLSWTCRIKAFKLVENQLDVSSPWNGSRPGLLSDPVAERPALSIGRHGGQSKKKVLYATLYTTCTVCSLYITCFTINCVQ